MIPSELPLLDETRCTHCGECVQVCPTQCLEMDGPLPWMPRPGDCVSCGLCVVVCPSGALRLAPLGTPLPDSFPEAERGR